jgi:hypothetical protein
MTVMVHPRISRDDPPTLLRQSELSYEVCGEENFASRQEFYAAFDGVVDPLVWMRGSTWRRWRRRGYWGDVWERYLTLNRLTIMSDIGMRRALSEFQSLANDHIARWPSYEGKVRPASHGGQWWLQSFGLSGFMHTSDRKILVRGEVMWLDTYEKRKIAKILAHEYLRAGPTKVKK